MKTVSHKNHSIYSSPPEIDGYDSLVELALDLRWSWNHATDKIWMEMDSELWELTQNPWVVLQTVSHDKIKSLLGDLDFRKTVDDLVQSRRNEIESPAWFQNTHPESRLSCVAYFSMEFMLSEALPIYSGGLGNVAGDQLKAASDLGVPVVGIGLLYQQGYFRQVIDKDGSQQALYPYNDPGQLPISPVRKANGEWLRLEIPLPGHSVWLRAWEVKVGRVKLFLLDSNDAANFPVHRGITSELYGGGPELRLKQEMLLGIGGWRLLKALGIEPDVCHLNEGHAAFAVLERARDFMRKNKQSFETALAVTRAGNHFTTHTAVAAGFDQYPPELIERFLGHYASKTLRISSHELLALGREHADDTSEKFNMAYLAIRGSGSVNGVSRLHGKVSRQLFSPLFPRWPQDEVPIGQVTNGVHMPTWDSAAADDLWTKTCGKTRWLGKSDELEEQIRGVSDEELWQFRLASSQSLIEYARKRLAMHYAAAGASTETVKWARHCFDPHALTLGFARRFATYKRPNLLLNDPERLLRLLSDSKRPVQLIIAGKAHPADKDGEALILQWIQFIRRHEVRPHAIFLSDYDMHLTSRLVQGVDVWLNTPRRPWEACGTSGMKVLVNGGINFSELDGWWAEAYVPELGWALGDGKKHGDDPSWDAAEAELIYEGLENEIVPEFYDRNEKGIPTAWLSRMRESMAQLTPRFSANRAVCEYTEGHYLPACVAYHSRLADQGALGRQIVDWNQDLEKGWGTMRFGERQLKTDDGQYCFEVQVYLNQVDPKNVRIELFADAAESGNSAVQVEMLNIRSLVGEKGGFLYSASVPASRPESDYTARIIPLFDGVTVPLENARILWQR